MDVVLDQFKDGCLNCHGYLLSNSLSPEDPKQLRAFYQSTNFQNVEKDIKYAILWDQSSPLRLPQDEGQAWVSVYVAYWKAAGLILKAEEDTENGDTASWTKVYEAWKDITKALLRGYSNFGFPAWTVPCLYVTGRFLRAYAIKADAELSNAADLQASFQDDLVADSGKNEKLEDAARVLNQVFTLCLSDRAPLDDSRKWGIYYIINLLFKTYFKLNSVSLSKNILRALQAGRFDMPPLHAFPKSHQVTFKYYVGVILFLEENYADAEQNLTEAWRLCYNGAIHNKELILTYLIPCHLLTTHTLPSQRLLAPYPHLQSLFLPLSKCIKAGDLSGFDAALAAGENEFVKRRIYLTLERGRDITLRNLLRKVFIAGGFEESKDDGSPPVRRTRIPVAELGAAIGFGSRERMDNDEVECLLANMIYKNLMKGYIAREAGKVVLNKKGAFPGTGV